MKPMRGLLWLGLVVLLAGCGGRSESPSEAGSGMAEERVDSPGMANVTLDTLDTLIHFDDLKGAAFRGPALTEEVARETLYRKCRAKGYFIEDQFPKNMTEKDYFNTVVLYDTTFLLDLNGNGNLDGLISYTLTLPYVSGRCWMPEYALVVDDGDGYRIVHEQLLPREFWVKRVYANDGVPVVEGEDWNCHDHVARRYFRVRL